MRLIAQLNLWFKAYPELANYWFNGFWMIPFRPLLGLVDSSDSEALLQEMQWVGRYTGRDGRNFIYSLEWIKPLTAESEAIDPVIDRNLQNAFLPAIAHTRSSWNIFYDPVLAALQRFLADRPPIDFSRPDVLAMFVDDLDYLAAYFAHPQYWHIDARPVLTIWAATDGIVGADVAFTEARRRGIYLLGDTFGRPGVVPPLDGRTGFAAATPELIALTRRWELPQVMPFFARYYAPAGDGLDVIPALSCQFDDTEFQRALGRPGDAVRILARNRQEVEAFLELARRHARPIAGERYVFAGTLDNWAEGTSLLPTIDKPGAPSFLDVRGGIERIGYYRFEHLEAVRRVLFPKVRPYRGPILRLRRDGTVDFDDCDRLGRLWLRGPGLADLAGPPDWASGRGFDERPGFRRRWRPAWRSAAAHGRRLRLAFRNLDGRSATLEIPAER